MKYKLNNNTGTLVLNKPWHAHFLVFIVSNPWTIVNFNEQFGWAKATIEDYCD
jgi:hypothetical protein